MKLAWLTDIHLNFVDEEGALAMCEAVGGLQPDAVLIGGDIAEGPTVVGWLEYLDAHMPAPVYFVLGNHDFYRSTFAAVHEAVAEFDGTARQSVWLGGVDAMPLADGVALMGRGGWADGRNGSLQGSRMMLNDFLLIDDLSRALSKDRLSTLLAAHADEEAALVEARLERAFVQYDTVLLLTHVPPFTEVVINNEPLDDAHYLPHFSSKVMGDTLRRVMATRPDKTLVVLAGHTHSASKADIAPNIHAVVGKAKYKHPAVAALLDTSRERWWDVTLPQPKEHADAAD